MQYLFKHSIILMSIGSVSIHAMSENCAPRGVNQNEAVLTVLTLAKDGLSWVHETVQEVHNADALNVESMSAFIKTGQSWWKYPALRAIEACLESSSKRESLGQKLKAYPADVALWLVRCMPHGTQVVDFCAAQSSAGQPITVPLEMARNPQKHILEFVTKKQKDIDQLLTAGYPLLQTYGPALVAGLEAMELHIALKRDAAHLKCQHMNAVQEINDAINKEDDIFYGAPEYHPQHIYQMGDLKGFFDIRNERAAAHHEADELNPFLEYSSIKQEQTRLAVEALSSIRFAPNRFHEEGMSEWCG